MRRTTEVVIKGIVIGAAGSGSGKTTITLGLLAAAKARGMSVAAFKVGPDFIDPGHHTHIIGRPSRNLDGWMLSEEQNLLVFSTAARGVDLAVVEGVMGLFDGYDGRSEAGSTAQMAKWLGLPVLLVVNAASMARSAAAVVQGFERFDPELSFAGVLFNRIGSPRHLGYLRDALEENVRMTVLGGVPRTEAVNIPERHLGLHTADDHPLTEAVIDRLSTLIESSMDLDAFFDRLPEVGVTKSKPVPDHRHPRPVRIGVARDRAFCFYYPDNLDMLEAAGAQLIDFSPIRSPSLPSGIDGLYFGGGYPELSAAELASNDRLRGEVLKASEAGMPIYGECGGFMYLCRELIDLDGTAHPLVGCFPMTTRMQSIQRSLGYREATLSEDTPLGPAGLTLRGHEFHYSDIERIASPVPTVYHVAPREGVSHAAEGYCLRQTLGSYLHLHFGSCPEAAAAFVDACMTYGRSRRP